KTSETHAKVSLKKKQGHNIEIGIIYDGYVATTYEISENCCFFLRLTNAFKQSAIFKFWYRLPTFIEKLQKSGLSVKKK
ncbi:MAG: hypothetical protein KKH68_06955, partial [Proteobacteria bacterium]|nr:hypothetical protein [Pseudomonadota bacterium]